MSRERSISDPRSKQEGLRYQFDEALLLTSKVKTEAK